MLEPLIRRKWRWKSIGYSHMVDKSQARSIDQVKEIDSLVNTKTKTKENIKKL